MTKYPSVDDDNFYKKIKQTFKEYTIPKKEESIEHYCKPKKFRLQQPQDFIGHFLSPNTPYKSILIYHKIGAGKTCAAIQIAEKWKKKRRIVFVLPASLRGNLRDELRSHCGGDVYLKQTERDILATTDPSNNTYHEIIAKSDERINKYYSIYSYNKFFDIIQTSRFNLKNAILIIDEIQNLVSERGNYYKLLYNFILNSPSDLRLILMSATPIFDRPVEIALTINLLRPSEPLPIGNEFENTFVKKTITNDQYVYKMKNIEYFKQLLQGYVSYYSGAPAHTFPKMKIKYIECEMSDFQHNVYKKLLRHETKQENIHAEDVINMYELPNNFYIGTRFVSNIVFPNKKVGNNGIVSLTTKKILNELATYSTKFNTLMTSINETKGKIFVYSTFKEYTGVNCLVKILEAHGYKNYITHGQGKHRFAVWSGDENDKRKHDIKTIFNMDTNLHGEKLRIILGSPSIKEGVSLKAVKYVHIVEPHWNTSRIEQVIGRANRFCSHVLLPASHRTVKVFIYLSVSRHESMTVDQFIFRLAQAKNKLIKQFERAIKEASIDCTLNRHANNEELSCAR